MLYVLLNTNQYQYKSKSLQLVEMFGAPLWNNHQDQYVRDGRDVRAVGTVNIVTEPFNENGIACYFRAKGGVEARTCQVDTDCGARESCRVIPYGDLGTKSVCIGNGDSSYLYQGKNGNL